MDPTRFDDLTKALASSTSRRQVLKTLAGTAAAGLLALSGIDQVFAKPCVKPGHHCKTTDCCRSGNFTGGCCNGRCCPSGQGCSNGTCVPLQNQFICDCFDGTQSTFCSTADCPGDLSTFCDTPCTGHGGQMGAGCTPQLCVP